MWDFTCLCELGKNCVCICVWVDVYLPPATLHLSAELARLKLACSIAPKAIHPLSGQCTLSILELKAKFPLVTECTLRIHSESQSRGWRTITDPDSDECEGNCQNWCACLLLGYRARVTPVAFRQHSIAFQQPLPRSATSPLFRPKQGGKESTDAVGSTFHCVREHGFHLHMDKNQQ